VYGHLRASLKGQPLVAAALAGQAAVVGHVSALAGGRSHAPVAKIVQHIVFVKHQVVEVGAGAGVCIGVGDEAGEGIGLKSDV